MSGSSGGKKLSTREFAESLFSRKAAVPDWISNCMPWIEDNQIYANSMAANPPQHLVMAVRSHGLAFHEKADTFTDAVASTLQSVGALPVIRVAHQPNTLAYGRAFGLLMRLNELARYQSMTPLYYYIDYDTVGNQRFRTVGLPDPRLPQGYKNISLGEPYRTHRTAISGLCTPPTLTWLDRIIESLRELIPFYGASSSLKKDYFDATRAISRMIHEVYDSPGSLAERNAALISKIANKLMGMPIVMVPGSRIWAEIPANVVCEILDNWSDITEALASVAQDLALEGVDVQDLDRHLASREVLPLWWICICGSRVPIMMYSQQIWTGSCPHCGVLGDVKASSAMELISTERHHVFPKILLQSALNVQGFGYARGIAHSGGAGHILVSSLTLERVARPALVQLTNHSWRFHGHPLSNARRSDSSTGLAAAQSFVESGQASIIYYLIGNEMRERLLEHYG